MSKFRIKDAQAYTDGTNIPEAEFVFEKELENGEIVVTKPIRAYLYGEKLEYNAAAFEALKKAKKIMKKYGKEFVEEEKLAELGDLIEKASKFEKLPKDAVSAAKVKETLTRIGLIFGAGALIGGIYKTAPIIGDYVKTKAAAGNDKETSIEASDKSDVTIEKTGDSYVVSAPSLSNANETVNKNNLGSFLSFEEAVPSEYDENAFEDAKVDGNFVTDISYEDFIKTTDKINKEFDEKEYGFNDKDVRAGYLLFNKDKLSKDDLTYLETTEVANTGETYINPTTDGKLRDIRDFGSNYYVRLQNTTAGTYSAEEVLPDISSLITNADTMKVYNKMLDAVNILSDKNTDKESAMKYYEAIQAWSMGLPSDLLGDPNSLNAGERYFFNQAYGRGLLNGMIVSGKLGNQKEADKLYDAIMGTYVDENGVTQGNTEIRRTENVLEYLDGACKAYRR